MMLLYILLLAPPIAPAAQAYDAGRQAYQQDDFMAAREHFETALGLLSADDPLRSTTLYNLARTVQEMDDPCQAVDYFRVYLDSPGGDARRQAKAEAAMAEARAQCDDRQVSLLPSDPTADPTADPPAVPLPVAPPRPADPPFVGDTRPMDPAAEGSWWPWVAAGATVATLAVGIGYSASASGHVADADAAFRRFEDSGRRDLDARARVDRSSEDATSARNVSYTMFGLTAAFAGVATWLFLTEPAVGLAAQGSGGSGWVQWRF